MNFKDVESARKRYHQKTKKAWRIIIAILLGVLGINIALGATSILVLIFPISFVFVIGVFIMAFTTRKEATAYRKSYKAYFVEQNLKNTFTDLVYAHDRGLNRNILISTGMINTGDRYSSNDLTIANYKNVKFFQADARIEEEYTDSDGDTHYTTIFKGRIMLYEFPKQFNFKLELIGKGFRAYRIPGASTSGRKMSKISTESTEFNRSFKIYGEDGFEAFYILDPAFMVKIQDIATHYKNRILFGFVENKLIIALNDGKDSFEPPKASKPIDEQAEMAKIHTDIKVITDFVDQLSLDRKLFKK